MSETTNSLITAITRRYVRAGRVEGLAEGKADALLLVLRARGFSVTTATRTRVSRCRSITTLDRWLARAATATRLTSVFAVR